MLTHLISCILFTNWAAQYCQPFIEGGLDIELRGTTGSTRPPLPLPPHTSPSPQIGEDTAWYSTLLSLSLPAHSITILPPNTIITSKCCFKNLHQQIFAWNMTVCLTRRWSVKEGRLQTLLYSVISLKSYSVCFFLLHFWLFVGTLQHSNTVKWHCCLHIYAKGNAACYILLYFLKDKAWWWWARKGWRERE